MPLTATPMIAAAASVDRTLLRLNAAHSAAVAATIAMTIERPNSSGLYVIRIGASIANIPE
jgi:hypothetical protein